jgi:plastocyanin
MGGVQDAGPVSTSPAVSPKAVEPKTQTDPFANLAEKVKSGANVVEEDAEAMAAEAKAAAMAEAEKAAKMAAEAKAAAMAEAEKAAKMAAEAISGPTTHTVDIPAGTSVPGCEESNTCYLPADITINVGDTVNWINIDTAAHTVTGGSPTDGPSGVFDSSLVMASAEFAFTFNDSGNYDYFCMVHPWMIGSVTVN